MTDILLLIVVSLTFVDYQLRPKRYWSYCGKSNILCDVTNYDPNAIEVIVVSLTFTVDYPVWCDQLRAKCYWSYCGKSNIRHYPVPCDQLRPKLYWSYCGKSNIHWSILCDVTNYDPNSIEVIVVSLTFIDYPVRCDQLRPKLYWSYCGKSNIRRLSCAMWPITSQTLLKLLW